MSEPDTTKLIHSNKDLFNFLDIKQTPKLDPTPKPINNSKIKANSGHKMIKKSNVSLFKNLGIDPYFINNIRHFSNIHPNWTHNAPFDNKFEFLISLIQNIDLSNFLDEFNALIHNRKPISKVKTTTLLKIVKATIILTGISNKVKETRTSLIAFFKNPKYKSNLLSTSKTIEFIVTNLNHNPLWFTNYLYIFTKEHTHDLYYGTGTKTIKEFVHSFNKFLDFYSKYSNNWNFDTSLLPGSQITTILEDFNSSFMDFISNWFSFQSQYAIARSFEHIIEFFNLFTSVKQQIHIPKDLSLLFNNGLYSLSSFNEFIKVNLSLTTGNILSNLNSFNQSYIRLLDKYHADIIPSINSYQQFNTFFNKLSSINLDSSYQSPKLKTNEFTITEIFRLIRDEYLSYKEANYSHSLFLTEIQSPDWYIPIVSLKKQIKGKLTLNNSDFISFLINDLDSVIELSDIISSNSNYDLIDKDFIYCLVFTTLFLTPKIHTIYEELLDIQKFVSDTRTALQKDNSYSKGQLFRIIDKCNRVKDRTIEYTYENCMKSKHSNILTNERHILDFFDKFTPKLDSTIDYFTKYELLLNSNFEKFITSNLDTIQHTLTTYSTEINYVKEIEDKIIDFFDSIKNKPGINSAQHRTQHQLLDRKRSTPTSSELTGQKNTTSLNFLLS